MENQFKFSQDVLIEYAGTMVGHLRTDLPDFTAFDPDLNEAKRDAMEGHIQWFLSEGGDEGVVADLMGKTSALMQELTECHRVYNQLRYWVIKSFPMDKATHRKFGIGRFARVADNQSSMVVFMGALAGHTADNRTALEAAGTPATLLDEVATRAEALRLANEDQEMRKGNRTTDTSERTSQLNALFQHTRDFNTAAEFVYFDNPTKRNLYRPPSNSDSADELPEETPEEMI